MSLNDALQLLRNGIEGDYGQHLEEALWAVHFKLSLDQSQSAIFHIIFLKDLKTEKVSKISMRMRVEGQKKVVLFGLWKAY